MKNLTKWQQGIILIATYVIVSAVAGLVYYRLYIADSSLYAVNSLLLSQKQREAIVENEQAKRELLLDTVEVHRDLKLFQLARYTIASETNSQLLRELLLHGSGACMWKVESGIFGYSTLDCVMRRIPTSADASTLYVNIFSHGGNAHGVELTVRTWSTMGVKRNSLVELRQMVLESLDETIHEKETELKDAKQIYDSRIQDIKQERLVYWDFLYFSFGVMSGMSTSDITPLSTQVRIIIMVQHVVSVILTAFVAFFVIERIEEKQADNQVVKKRGV